MSALANESRNLETTWFNWQAQKTVFRRKEIFSRHNGNKMVSEGIGYKAGPVTFKRIVSEYNKIVQYRLDIYGLKIGYIDTLKEARIIGGTIYRTLLSWGKSESLDKGDDVAAWQKELECVMPIIKDAIKMGRLMEFAPY